MTRVPPNPFESPLLLAAIVEGSDDAIISKDLNGIVTSWNRSAERIFGYTAEEVIGQPISIIAPPERKDEMYKILDRIKHGEKVDHYDTQRRAKDGRILDVSLTVSPVRDSSGKIVGASKIARDITERKQAERAIMDQAERLARSNADLQEFAYVTSHDLQEPLRTIATFAELLRRRHAGRLDKESEQHLELMVQAALRMSALIRDVLSYSKELSDKPIAMGKVNCATSVEWALENLQLTLDETGAKVETGKLPVVVGDKAGLSQVFQNLIGNAVKYRGEQPPEIKIDAHENGDGWLFSVADNGIGIPKPYHESIFGLFKRLHSSPSGGTGIGLALCKKIIEKHGGRIWVESEPGQGSTFRFTIPRNGLER